MKDTTITDLHKKALYNIQYMYVQIIAAVC